MKKIRVVEVGPRDGLQNEATMRQLNLEELIQTRVDFILSLANSGLIDIEIGAFVRSDRVPAMASTDKVVQILKKDHGDLWKNKNFWVLVPNSKGLELAMKSGAKHISVFTATSDAFNQKNIQMSVKESLEHLNPVIKEAKQSGLTVRGYISTVWGCPYAGNIPAQKAREVSDALWNMGVKEVSLGDTIGVATPKQVKEVLQLFSPSDPIAVHFHDTRGTSIANCLEAIQLGVTTVDSSAGGLGGCPYARGASGNLATEDLLYMLHGMGFQTGVDIEKVCFASEALEKSLEITLPSRYFKAWKGSTGRA